MRRAAAAAAGGAHDAHAGQSGTDSLAAGSTESGPRVAQLVPAGTPCRASVIMLVSCSTQRAQDTAERWVRDGGTKGLWRGRRTLAHACTRAIRDVHRELGAHVRGGDCTKRRWMRRSQAEDSPSQRKWPPLFAAAPLLHPTRASGLVVHPRTAEDRRAAALAVRDVVQQHAGLEAGVDAVQGQGDARRCGKVVHCSRGASAAPLREAGAACPSPAAGCCRAREAEKSAGTAAAPATRRRPPRPACWAPVKVQTRESRREAPRRRGSSSTRRRGHAAAGSASERGRQHAAAQPRTAGAGW